MKTISYFKVKSFFIIYLFVLASNYAYGQRYDKFLKSSTEDAGLIFKMPKGFYELDSTAAFKCWDYKSLPGSILYLISNSDTSVVIGFVNIMRIKSPNYNTLINVAKTMSYNADSNLFVPKNYDAKLLKSRFNADVGVEFSRNCVTPFLGRYGHNRFVSIGKANGGEATMVYFFRDKEQDINTVIEKTSGMLKFK